jgi:hypothetical protein
MTLHTETTARTRLVSANYNGCPRCSAHLLAPSGLNSTSSAHGMFGRAKRAAINSKRRCIIRPPSKHRRGSALA